MIEFQNLSNESHHCTTHREGDWIVWRCPFCHNYERRLNIKTNQMTVRGKTDYQHVGSFLGNAHNGVQSGLIKNINKINQN